MWFMVTGLKANFLTDTIQYPTHQQQPQPFEYEESTWFKAMEIEEEYEQGHARAKLIKQTQDADLADEQEDFYDCPEEPDRFSELASELIRMIASWLPTRSWQTILTIICTQTHQATKPAVAVERPVWKDTRSSIWAQKATAEEKKRWNDMHYPGWNEAATSDEEDWEWYGQTEV